jgi:multidrug resistance efflux pump
LDYERSELKRYDELLRQNVVSTSEVELKRSLTKELEASLGQLDVLLKEAKTRQSRIELIAPFDGSVVAKHTELGAYVSIGS